jgi:hypothetical protein
METVSFVSIALGSAFLLALLASIAIGDIRKRKTPSRKKVISAVDSKWKKLKVEIAI